MHAFRHRLKAARIRLSRNDSQKSNDGVVMLRDGSEHCNVQQQQRHCGDIAEECLDPWSSATTNEFVQWADLDHVASSQEPQYLEAATISPTPHAAVEDVVLTREDCLEFSPVSSPRDPAAAMLSDVNRWTGLNTLPTWGAGRFRTRSHFEAAADLSSRVPRERACCDKAGCGLDDWVATLPPLPPLPRLITEKLLLESCCCSGTEFPHGLEEEVEKVPYGAEAQRCSWLPRGNLGGELVLLEGNGVEDDGAVWLSEDAVSGGDDAHSASTDSSGLMGVSIEEGIEEDTITVPVNSGHCAWHPCVDLGSSESATGNCSSPMPIHAVAFPLPPVYAAKAKFHAGHHAGWLPRNSRRGGA